MTVTDRADAPAPSPAEQAVIDRFGIFAEERVVEEVARAMWESCYGGTWDLAWDEFCGTPGADPGYYRRLAAAAVSAYRAQDGGADLATALADQGLRSCCGQPSAEHCR